MRLSKSHLFSIAAISFVITILSSVISVAIETGSVQQPQNEYSSIGFIPSKADSVVFGSNKRRFRDTTIIHDSLPSTNTQAPSRAYLIKSRYPNIRVDNSSQNFQPQEMSIAINPTNPNNLVAGSNKKYYFYSFDKGATWTGKTQTSQYNMCGDPCIVFDLDGVVYYGHISEPASYWPDRIVVHKSTDNGATWSQEYGIGYAMLNATEAKNQDKEWLAVDLSGSPYKNSVYVSWTEFDKYDSSNPQHKTKIRFSYTRDKGAKWSEPIVISDTMGGCLDDDNAVEGAVPAVGPNGEVYDCWAAYEKIYFDKSLDGGVTFGKDKVIAHQLGGWTYAVSGVYRCNGMPIVCTDISNTHYRGNIYVNWSDQRNGATDTDIFFIKSTDGGQTWTSPFKVNNDTSKRHQFFCWMCVDPITAYIYIVFYDRRNTTGDATDVYVARSKDGGDTFENMLVSQSSFTPTSTVFFGDYTGIAAYNGTAYPIWSRMDNGKLSAYIAVITETVPVIHALENKSLKNFELVKSSLNPTTLQASVTIKIQTPQKLTLFIYSLQGKLLKTISKTCTHPGEHTLRWDASNKGSGVCLYKISTDNTSLVQRLFVF